MKLCSFLIVASCLFASCSNSQPAETSKPKLLGDCEGCEGIFEFGDRKLKNADTLPEFHKGEKKIRISGTIYQPDGKTPAKDVILYIYHTNEAGIYPSTSVEKGWGRRHGYLRGWIKTGADGKYSFYTFWPGIYPTRNAPAHIHPMILEPDGKYYWLNDILFEGDSLIKGNETRPEYLRGGGTGVLKMQQQGDLWVGVRDIILGKNVPGYK